MANFFLPGFFNKTFSLKLNIFANFAGTAWQAVLNLGFVPVYLWYLGVEAYGLIGVFAIIQAVLALLDIGLSPMMSRELARLSAQPDKAQEMRDTVRTLESVYWVLAAAGGVITLIVSPFLAVYWINPGQIPTSTVQQVFAIMGISFVAQFSLSLYTGGLVGLQKQVQLNAVNSFFVTIRNVVSVIVISQASEKILAFFVWQAISYILQSITVGLALWRSLPKTEKKAKFQRELLNETWRFAAGMTGINITALVLMQLDKVILSRMLSLRDFGYYALAGTVVTNVFGLLMSPSISFYPKFSNLAEIGDEHGLRKLYHQGSQLMSILIFPASAVLIFFSYELLLLWTRNAEVAANAYLLVSALMVGTAINGLMRMPYYLQLAHGWTKLVFYSNLVGLLVLIPLIIGLTTRFGALGGCLAWMILNVSYFFTVVQIMHRRLLKNELKTWYFRDVLLPLAASLLIVIIARRLFNGNYSPPTVLIGIGLISAATLGAAIAVIPQVRLLLLNYFITFLTARRTQN